MGCKREKFCLQQESIELTQTKEEKAKGSQKREKWESQVEFIFSSLSFAVGLGNIWRFPYLCYNNGGGAFLIPYTIMLIFCGFPLVFFELCLGQFGREGPITVWKIVPLFQGIGYAMFMISFYIGCYYNVLLAWTIYYIYSSLTSTLPWTTCDYSWNTQYCKSYDYQNCTDVGGLMDTNGTCLYQEEVDSELWTNLKENVKFYRSSSYEFFHQHVLNISPGVDYIESFQPHIVLSLAIAWIVVYLVLIKGVKTFGKAVYFTATFPYLVLTILLIRAATLPGYMNGIYFYLTPQWEKLGTIKIWAESAMQIFFSLGPCWGSLITLSSFNEFKNNCYRDALIISLGNCLTSFFSGFVIFGVIGFMAHELGQPVDQVAVQGAGLAFVAYPEAVARMPISPVWSLLFFTMLLTLGLGTQFTILTTITTTITDNFPHLRGKSFNRWTLLGCCSVMFLVGLSMTTDAGIYILQIFDSYSATFSALMVGGIEVLAVTWIYGVDRFLDDIEFMIGFSPYPRVFWKYLWKFVMPITILILLVFSMVDFAPPTYESYIFPKWVSIVGWLLSFSSVLFIPCVAVVKMIFAKGTISERFRFLCQPSPSWCPPVRGSEDEKM